MDYRQRRKEQAQQTEQAILQAAMELARENSFDKVSVRDICQRAGITTAPFTTTSVPRRTCSPVAFPPWTGTWRRPCPATRLTPRPSGFG